MAPKVEQLTEIGSLELGEGPHWNPETQSLYFVDIFGNSIHRYDPVNKKHTKAVIGAEPVSLIIPVENKKDKYIITIKRKVALVTWDGESEKVADLEILGEVENTPELQGNRFNDGKADPSGRLWLGTMGEEKTVGTWTPYTSSLYSYDQNKGFAQQITGISLSNGLAWNRELKKFYYIDTPQHKIFQFDYDEANGTISNQRTIFTLEKHGIEGVPDGQTIDTDGNLWVAIPNGYRIIKIDPRRPETLLETVKIPAKQPTSVAFGGANLDELYVTTARLKIDGVELKPEDGHGYLYRITNLGATGFPGVNVKL